MFLQILKETYFSFSQLDILNFSQPSLVGEIFHPENHICLTSYLQMLLKDLLFGENADRTSVLAS